MRIASITLPVNSRIGGRPENFISFRKGSKYANWRAEHADGVIRVYKPDGQLRYTIGMATCVCEWDAEPEAAPDPKVKGKQGK